MAQEAPKIEDIEKERFLFNEEDIKDFPELRKIEKDDFTLIEKCAEFPKNFFFDYHNSFSINHPVKYQIEQLQSHIKNLEHDMNYAVGEKSVDEIKKRIELAKLLYSLLEKYDAGVLHRLITVFERRKKK